MPPLLIDRPRRVLITGAAGAVGSYIAPILAARGHHIRGFDRVPMPALPDSVVGDLTDPEAIARAVVDQEVVIHLAAYPNGGDFMTQILGANLVGVHHVLEQAQKAGVPRVVIASTVQVVNGAFLQPDRQLPIPPTLNAANNNYGVSKLYAEEYLRMYHIQHGMQGIAARLGWFLRTPAEAQRLGERDSVHCVYLSHDDAAEFFRCCIEVERIGFAQLWCLSGAPGGPVFDLQPGMDLIGYTPKQLYPVGLPESWPRG